MKLFEYKERDEFRVEIMLKPKRKEDKDGFYRKIGDLEYYVDWHEYYWNSKQCDSKGFDTYDEALKYCYECINK